jgi:hypothetical protein
MQYVRSGALIAYCFLLLVLDKPWISRDRPVDSRSHRLFLFLLSLPQYNHHIVRNNVGDDSPLCGLGTVHRHFHLREHLLLSHPTCHCKPELPQNEGTLIYQGGHGIRKRVWCSNCEDGMFNGVYETRKHGMMTEVDGRKQVCITDPHVERRKP